MLSLEYLQNIRTLYPAQGTLSEGSPSQAAEKFIFLRGKVFKAVHNYSAVNSTLAAEGCFLLESEFIKHLEPDLQPNHANCEPGAPVSRPCER
jgi:hypothetical protein